MQLRTRTWALISLVCLIGAFVCWRLGRDWQQRRPTPPAEPTTPAPAQGSAPIGAASRPAANLPSPANPALPANAGAVAASTNAATATNKFWFRLSNTTKTVAQLIQSEHSLLLRNALLDTDLPANLAIPPHLRAPADAGAYVVQARGTVDDAFRAQLASAGATIVAYVPNNAYLVRVAAAGAEQLAAAPGTQTVLPWAPYFKLDPKLLPFAIDQQPLPENSRLNLLFFSGERAAVRQSLADAGVEVLNEERSPFGLQFAVRAPADALVPLAQRSDMQAIEPFYERVLANDLSRARVLITSNTLATAENYLGLTGQGVRVNVNDTGVDSDHPDLAPRVQADQAGALVDFQGHGTHVAGTIASSGANGPLGEAVPGSATNASFRGMAPEAEIFAMAFNLDFGPNSDTYLQETAARTNAFISNNSWSYGVPDYTFASASWDAAVRDALPGQSNAQPLLVVFAAGNSGRGNDEGGDGDSDTMDAPGNGKNIIAVGAIENLRNITNTVIVNGATNQPWLGETDSTNRVAAFSARGNVSPGIEGEFGRFKPDVVAPGTFLASTRSGQWADPAGGRSLVRNSITNELVRRDRTNLYLINIPQNGIRLDIRLSRAPPRTDPLPPLQIWAAPGAAPPTPADFRGINNAGFPVTRGFWSYAIVNTNDVDVRCDIRTLITITNDPGTTFIELKKLNDLLLPYYRFESGTSMSAPVVSGMLALMQEYFAQRGQMNSPALMKALLISGARTVSPQDSRYGYEVKSTVNDQGWGLVNVTNSIPISLTNGSGPMLMWDQSPTNALATGQSITRTITVASNAVSFPLRFTLVWTDPPGNPTVGLKLVNDLDLIVTNLVTGDIFVGNDIGSRNLFNSISSTNSPLMLDRVNNVENVFVNWPLSGSYSVTVAARRVNVNAVSQHTNAVVQDFALVIASGETSLESALSESAAPVAFDPNPPVVFVTNGIPVLNQRAGANSPLIGGTNGVVNQWNFYVVTNLPPNSNEDATNIAFVTFLPPEVSRLRFFPGCGHRHVRFG